MNKEVKQGRQIFPMEVLNELEKKISLRLEDDRNCSDENLNNVKSQHEIRVENTCMPNILDASPSEPAGKDRSLPDSERDIKSSSNDDVISFCTDKDEEPQSSDVISAMQLSGKFVQRDTNISNDDIRSEESNYELKCEIISSQTNLVQHRSEHDGNTYNNCLMGIYVRGSDYLKFSPVIRHPSVVVHVVDLETGMYLEKSEGNRNVTYNQENSDHILPVMLRPFEFKEKRSLIPRWDELVVFNEPFSYLVKSSVIIFFEVVDFIDFSEDSSVLIDKTNPETGWHHIAWAFLKLVIANDEMNVEKELRLQLYKPNLKLNSTKKIMNIPKIFHWYSHKPWVIYPSTIYVTIKRMAVSAIDNKPQQRSQTPLQPELGSKESRRSISVCSSENDISDEIIYPIEHNSIKWERLPGQSCKIPNCKVLSLNAGSRGCLCLTFSHSGKFIACGTLSDIFVYGAVSGTLNSRLIGHGGLIYSVRWYKDDSMLLSCSADCTVCLWNVELSSPSYILPHPSYVYCCEFVTDHSGIITGCFDSIVRVWTHISGTNSWELFQELTKHNGYVNALCAINDSEFYSGDSVGIILRWSYTHGRWKNVKVVKLKEIQGVIINNLVKHPKGKRLLIHTRDSLLRIMDLYTCAVIQWFQGGGPNDTFQSGCALTPCGSLLFSISEDGTINVWDVNTGNHVALYSGQLVAGCGAIDYHPHDHIVAFSSYSTSYNSNVVILKYVKDATNNNCGLRSLQESLVSDEIYNQPSYRKPSNDYVLAEDNTIEPPKLSSNYVRKITKPTSVTDEKSKYLNMKNRNPSKLENVTKLESNCIERILKRMDGILLSHDNTSTTGTDKTQVLIGYKNDLGIFQK